MLEQPGKQKIPAKPTALSAIVVFCPPCCHDDKQFMSFEG